jgi:hypothetical protein
MRASSLPKKRKLTCRSQDFVGNLSDGVAPAAQVTHRSLGFTLLVQLLAVILLALATPYSLIAKQLVLRRCP